LRSQGCGTVTQPDRLAGWLDGRLTKDCTSGARLRRRASAAQPADSSFLTTPSPKSFIMTMTWTSNGPETHTHLNNLAQVATLPTTLLQTCRQATKDALDLVQRFGRPRTKPVVPRRIAAIQACALAALWSGTCRLGIRTTCFCSAAQSPEHCYKRMV
jgi:hypothetical protein